MPNHTVDALRAEWQALFDRVLQAGRHIGAEEALSGLMESARAKLSGPPGFINITSPSQIKRPRAQLSEEAKRRLAAEVRAPSGSVQRDILAILGRAFAPASVQEIVRVSAENGSELKDTSVRMALKALNKKGQVSQNDIGEWMLSAKHLRSDVGKPGVEESMFDREAA